LLERDMSRLPTAVMRLGTTSGRMSALSILRKSSPGYATYIPSRSVHGSSRVLRARPKITPPTTPIMVARVSPEDLAQDTTASLEMAMVRPRPEGWWAAPRSG